MRCAYGGDVRAAQTLVSAFIVDEVNTRVYSALYVPCCREGRVECAGATIVVCATSTLGLSAALTPVSSNAIVAGRKKHADPLHTEFHIPEACERQSKSHHWRS